MSTLRPVSNQASWTDTIVFRDDGVPLDISTATEITLRLRDPDCGNNHYALQASLTGDSIIREASVGFATFSFTQSQMQSLCPRTYEIGVLITRPSGVFQAVLGYQPVVKGL